MWWCSFSYVKMWVRYSGIKLKKIVIYMLCMARPRLS